MNTPRTTLLVEGMNCGSCARHVQNALRKIDGVRSVEVRLTDGTVLVEHGSMAPSPAAMIDALGGAGYPAHLSAA